MTVANLAGGLAMQWYIIAVLGAGHETDALFASLALPQALLATFASSSIAVLVPLLAGTDETAFRRTAWTFTGVTLGAFCGFAIALAAAVNWWVPLLAPGLADDAATLAIQLAPVQLLAMALMALAGVLGAIQRARHHFVWTEASPLISTVIAAGVLWFSLERYGIHAAAWVQVLRVGLHALLLAPGLGAFQGFTRDAETLSTAWQRLRPLVVGTVWFRIEPLFDRGISSLAPAGELSLFYLCQQFSMAVLQLANNALIAPLTPLLARHARTGDLAAFSRDRREGLRKVAVLATIAYLGVIGAILMLGAAELLGLGRTATTRRAVWVLVGLAGVFVAGPIFEGHRSALYASGDTARPVRAEAVVFTIGMAAKAAGFWAFGIVGLAAASSLQAAMGEASMRWLVRRFERRGPVAGC